jgi:L-ascorbate metabolism protein UlaG (beta-lactamase superfamily)
MELKWLGHASWKLKADGKTIYIDPYEGEYEEKADIVLISHSHDDHCKPNKVKAATGPRTVVIAPADCAAKIGTKVKSLKPGGKTKIGEIEIEAVEAYNNKRFRSPGVPFHPKGLGVGYLIRAEGKTIYHTGDTDLIPEMKSLKGIDLMLVASGGTYTMDMEEAAEATITVNPKTAIPMHTWGKDPEAFKRRVEAAGKTNVKIMKAGETYSL